MLFRMLGFPAGNKVDNLLADLLLDYPIRKVGIAFDAEIDSDFDDLFKRIFICVGIAFQVDLAKGIICRAVEFYLHHIYAALGFECDVNPPFVSAHFYLHSVICQNREYYIQHLLVMTLVCRVVAIRHCRQKVAQQPQRAIHIAFVYKSRHFGYLRVAVLRVFPEIIGKKRLIQAGAYLLVGYLKMIDFVVGVVAFDCQVAALIEQWGERVHSFCRRVES